MRWLVASSSDRRLPPARMAESGTISAAIAARIRSATDQPFSVSRNWPNGTSRSWPDEPPALAMPRYMLRLAGGATRLTVASTMGNPVMLMPNPVMKPTPIVASRGALAPAISHSPAA